MDFILFLLLALLFLPLVLSFRKQRRQVAQLQQMQSAIGVGDRVMTTSGVHATVVAVGEDTLDLEIAPGVVTTWVRPAIRERLVEPATEDDTTENGATGSSLDSTVADEADRR